VGDTFLGPLVRWFGLAAEPKFYQVQLERGESLDITKRPRFQSNILIESYHYPNNKMDNSTYVKFYHDGKEFMPWNIKKKLNNKNE